MIATELTPFPTAIVGFDKLKGAKHVEVTIADKLMTPSDDFVSVRVPPLTKEVTLLRGEIVHAVLAVVVEVLSIEYCAELQMMEGPFIDGGIKVGVKVPELI